MVVIQGARHHPLGTTAQGRARSYANPASETLGAAPAPQSRSRERGL